MGIKIKIKERNGKFTSSHSGSIQKNVTVYHQFENYRDNRPRCDYDFGAHQQYDNLCADISTMMSLWQNLPTQEDKTLSVSDITLTVDKENVIIESKTFENTHSFENKFVHVHLEKKVTNSVVSSWKDRNWDFLEEKIKYEIDTEDSSSFHFSNPYGEKIDRKESVVLEDSNGKNPVITIEPRESVDFELTAVKYTVKAKITYECKNDKNARDISYSCETMKLVLYSNPELEY